MPEPSWLGTIPRMTPVPTYYMGPGQIGLLGSGQDMIFSLCSLWMQILSTYAQFTAEYPSVCPGSESNPPGMCICSIVNIGLDLE